MKYYIIAGEPSGDLHGANLMRAILKKDPQATFMFWGGDMMLEVSENIVQHIRQTSIMGFVEVARNVTKIASFFKRAKSSILEFDPDVIVFIDYPGFNLRMAKWAKKRGFKTAYYISPQLWAWKKGRIKTIKACIDRMIVILPFEKEFYAENGVEVHYVGHPLVPVIENFKVTNSLNPSRSTKKILAVLPGSRKQEISKMLPIMLMAAKEFKDAFEVRVAIAPNMTQSFYYEIMNDIPEFVQFEDKSTYELLSISDLALVASGTATLETALFGVPQVVCYKTSWLNYQIGKRLVDLEYISLVNLISGQEIVPELIQERFNTSEVVNALHRVFRESQQIKSLYVHLKDKLRTELSPSVATAEVVVDLAHL